MLPKGALEEAKGKGLEKETGLKKRWWNLKDQREHKQEKERILGIWKREIAKCSAAIKRKGASWQDRSATHLGITVKGNLHPSSEENNSSAKRNFRQTRGKKRQ